MGVQIYGTVISKVVNGQWVLLNSKTKFTEGFSGLLEFLVNCFGIEMELCDFYLKRFDLIKGLLCDSFLITVW